MYIFRYNYQKKLGKVPGLPRSSVGSSLASSKVHVLGHVDGGSVALLSLTNIASWINPPNTKHRTVLICSAVYI